LTVTTADAAPQRRFAGLHPVLFAAYAVLFLWSQNLGETNASRVLVPLVAVVAVTAVLTVLLGRAFGDRRRGALVVTPLVIGFLMYGHVARNVADLGVPGFIQQAGWVALTILGILGAWRLDARQLAAFDRALVAVSAILVLVTLVLIVPYEARAMASRGSATIREPAATTTRAPKRDVYWLVLDRYGSDRALDLRYGYDNTGFTDWLTEQGFTVLPDSHANYIRTVLSLATTANMAHLEELTGQDPSSEDLEAVDRRLQDPLVARQFKALGYTYHHIGSWWDPTRSDAGADVNHLPPAAPIGGDFIDALYDVSAVPAIRKRLGIPAADSDERHHTYNAYGLDALDALVDEPGPKFVLGHVLLPHGPFVFDRDGSYLDEEAAQAAGLSPEERYARQQDYTNERLQALLARLLAKPEAERPIVILQADEGPWPVEYTGERKTTSDWAERATPEALEEKYGILNAWYIPGVEDLGLDPSMSAINTFPTLFARYFGIPYPLLEERVYASRDWYHPYDLTDITDRLPSLQDR
jgi:hypothetical protein